MHPHTRARICFDQIGCGAASGRQPEQRQQPAAKVHQNATAIKFNLFHSWPCPARASLPSRPARTRSCLPPAPTTHLHKTLGNLFLVFRIPEQLGTPRPPGQYTHTHTQAHAERPSPSRARTLGVQALARGKRCLRSGRLRHRPARPVVLVFVCGFGFCGLG